MARQLKSTNYFSHDSNARNDEKLVRLRMKHGAAGYGVYFMILERLREESNYMSVKDYNMIAFDLRVDAAFVKSVVEGFGLFVFTEGGEYFYSDSFNRRMDAKDALTQRRSEAGKKGNQKRWGVAKQSQSDRTASQKAKTTATPAPQPAETCDNATYLKRFFGRGNSANLEAMLKNFGLKPDDLPTLKELANDVISQWELSDKQHPNYTDWSQHLISTMRIICKERQATATDTQPPVQADYQFGGGFGGKDV